MDNQPPGTPRWVKELGVVAAVLILLVVVAMLVGGGEHGPGRHASSGNAGGLAPASGIASRVAPRP